MNGFLNSLKSKRLYLDGAMGSLVQEKISGYFGLIEEFNITDPGIIIDIHKAYIESGANIILTNTFGANKYKLQKSRFSVEELIKAGVANAKLANPDYIALDIAPLGLLVDVNISFEEAVSCYREMVTVGVKEGVDLILFETMTDINEAKAAITAAKSVTDLPVGVSFSYDTNERTLTGSNPATVANLLQNWGVDIIGTNCSIGPEAMVSIVRQYIEVTKLPILVEPNAGLPVFENGKTFYSMNAEEYSDNLVKIANLGVGILGGCCGTTPNFLKKVVHKTQNSPLIKEGVPKEMFVSSAYNSVKIHQDATIGNFNKNIFKEAALDNKNILKLIKKEIKRQISLKNQIVELDLDILMLKEIDIKNLINVMNTTRNPFLLKCTDSVVQNKILSGYRGIPFIKDN